MLGPLDVTKVVWENCPAALKGQYQGKEKVATIGLEAVSDANLWIWHRVFGFPGTLNDINIFERSPLFQSMQDGSHSEIDFDFEVDGHTFQKLYYLVDGIYPWLTRFLATISDPKTKIASYFATRQEAIQKDIERAFGVLKKKFLCLKHPILYHHKDDIFYVVYACIAMHNMMVQYRVDEEGSTETSDFYATSHLEDLEAGVGDDFDQDPDNNVDDDSDESVQEIRCDNYESSDPNDMAMKYEMVQRRWKELYDIDGAKKLQQAVMNDLYRNRYGDAAMDECNELVQDYNPLQLN